MGIMANASANAPCHTGLNQGFRTPYLHCKPAPGIDEPSIAFLTAPKIPLDDLILIVWGHVGLVYEYTLGEEKFTFIEKRNLLCHIIDQRTTTHATQIKDAIRDGLSGC